MEFENTFVVQAPIAQVWELLLDVERITPCMPGAQVLEQIGDDAYKVAVKVRIGPMTMNYKGDVEIVDQDATTHRATMRAKAKEARGQGTASADIQMFLREQPGGTEAAIVTTMQMSGKAAAMGQSVMKDIASALTDTFAKNLQALVEPASSASPPATKVAAAEAPSAEVPGAKAPVATPPVADASATPEIVAGDGDGDGEGAAPADVSLPAGQIATAVVVSRLKDPKTLGVLGVIVLLLTLLRRRRD